MLAAGQGKRLAAQVGKREVGGETQLAGKSLKSHMVRTLHYRGPFPGPAQPRLTGHGNSRCAFNRLDDSDQLRRPERTAELQKPGGEINHAERARRGLKSRLKNVRIWLVALGAGFSSRRSNAKAPAILAVQEG